MENASGIATLLILGCAYFFPWLVAIARNHHNRGAICLLNLLLGWTVLGWVAAIVWAATEVHHPVKAAN